MQIPAFPNGRIPALNIFWPASPETLMQLAAEPLPDFLQEMTIGSPLSEKKR